MLSWVSRTIAEHDLFADARGAAKAAGAATVDRVPRMPRVPPEPAPGAAAVPVVATRVVVAVSGGPDSMALLACLWELSARLGLTLDVACVDHGLRPEAVREADLVAERASALGLRLHRLRVDVLGARNRPAGDGGRVHGDGEGDGSSGGGGAGSGRGSVQEVARRLRQAALVQLAGELGAATIALGHNADDQAETVLFRILRGTGVDGLAGIPYRRGPFVRPLLDVSRAQILEYLKLRSIPFMEDPSNHDFRFTRARIRHRVLPFLRQENPRIDEALQRLAASAAGRLPAAATLAALTGGHLATGNAEGHAGEGGARSAGAGAAKVGVGGVAGGVGPTPTGAAPVVVAIPARVALPVAAAARAARGTRSFDLPGARRIVVTYGRVSIIQRADEAANAGQNAIAVGRVQVPGAGSFALEPGRWLRVREIAGEARPEGESPWFDGDRLVWPLTVRARRPGDRMRPRGGRGSRKVADLMIDAKIPVSERALRPVVVDGEGELLFVEGLRPSETGRPSEGTRRWIELSVRDHGAAKP